MTKPFFERLEKYYSEIGKVLKGESNAASIFPNKTDIGMTRERVYAEVLKTNLPSSCNVYFGGFIFDLEGNESNQIDLIITNDKALQFNFHNQGGDGKTFSCIDGCVGIASIKSNLDSSQLIESLNNIASLPEKSDLTGKNNPMLKIPDYDDWPYKIIFASEGVNIETAMATLRNFYNANSDIPLNKRPNLIHVAGKYLLIRVGEGTTTRDGTKIEANTYHPQISKVDEFGIPYAVTRIQQIATAANQVIFSYANLLDKLPLK